MRLLCGLEPAMRKAILFSLVLLVLFASTKCGNLDKEKAKRYFAEVKKKPLKEFNKIFIVKEIKNNGQ